MVGPKSSIATRKEMKVPKKPLASWMMLVARIRIPICARSDFDRISFLPCSGLDDSRARASQLQSGRGRGVRRCPDGVNVENRQEVPTFASRRRDQPAKGNIFDHRLA